MDSRLINPLAIVLGAIIIGLAIVGAQFMGRYQIVPAVSNGTSFVWRLDARTGEIESCSFYRSTIVCVKDITP